MTASAALKKKKKLENESRGHCLWKWRKLLWSAVLCLSTAGRFKRTCSFQNPLLMMGLVSLPHFSVNKLPWASRRNRDLNIVQSSRMEVPCGSAARECVWTARRPLHIDFSTSVIHWFLWRAYSDNEPLPSSGHGLHSNTCLSFAVWRHFIPEDGEKHCYSHFREKETFFLIYWYFLSSSVTAARLTKNVPIRTIEHWALKPTPISALQAM